MEGHSSLGFGDSALDKGEGDRAAPAQGCEDSGRDTGPRVSRVPVTQKAVDEFYEPFSHFDPSAPYPPTVARELLGAPAADPGDFPANISEYIWLRPGFNDEDEWWGLFRLAGGNYLLLVAGCDYSGFDCQGWIDYWCSPNLAAIVNYGMTDWIYDAYFAATRPAPDGTLLGLCLERVNSLGLPTGSLPAELREKLRERCGESG